MDFIHTHKNIIISIILILFVSIIYLTYVYYYELNGNVNIDKYCNILIEKFESSYTGFKPIIPNGQYFGFECSFVKNDSFYDILKLNDYKLINDITKACLIVPCTYDKTESEINELKDNFKNNIFGDSVRIFMLNNSDFMVSKLMLYKMIENIYGKNIATTIMPKTWDLTTNDGIDIFKREFNPNKIYITKNNNQRQEGINIHTNLEEIINSKKLLVQELLQNPYCIDGHKINLRVYCLVICDNYKNIKIQIYKNGFMYYTPEKFELNNPDFKKNITTGYIDRAIYDKNPLTHNDFKIYLDDNTRNLSNIEKYVKSQNIILSNLSFVKIRNPTIFTNIRK